MPRGFHYKIAALGAAGIPYVDFNRTQDGVILYYDTQDAVGSTVMIAFNPALALGRRLENDGGLEIWTDATNLTNWNKTIAGASTLDREGTIVDTGTFSAKFTVVSAGNCRIDQASISEINKTYTLSFRVKSSVIGRRMQALFAGGSANSTGSTDWETVALPVTANANNATIIFQRLDGGTYNLYLDSIELRQTDIAASSEGLGLLDGGITGLTLGVNSGTLLENLASSDGINDNLSIDSAELNSFINFDNLSFDMWAIADTWAAGTDYLFSLEIDGDNYYIGYRDGTNLVIAHKGGAGTEKTVVIASGSPVGLFHFGGSIDTDGSGTITGIYNGVPGGTATSLGTIVGNLSSDKVVVGASDDSGSNSWAGDWGHPSLFNITLDNAAWLARFAAGGV